MTDEDRFLLDRAVAEGTLTREKADDCETLSAVGEGKKPVRDILLEKKYLDEKQVERLRKLFRILAQEKEDRALGKLLVDKGRIASADIDACLAQQRQEKKEGKFIPLAKFLVARRLATKEEIAQFEFSPQFHTYVEQEKLSWRSPERKPQAEEAMASERLGGYELRGRIAAGGMGVIYRAWQVGLEREVALKVLSSELQGKPDFVEKFLREAKMAAKLNHPNLVQIYDVGQEGPRVFYSMELVEGTNLHELLTKETRLPQERSIDFLLQIAKGLVTIHAHGIIHRDIKPDNVIIRKDGIAKLVDLGLAKERGRAKTETSMGNPYYIAPELISSPDQVDVRADIYSLGATFYRMLTGRRPVDGKTTDEILENLLHGEPTPIQDIDHTLSEDVAKICKRMMAKDPAKRYMAMEMVVGALDKLLFFG
ncbi:MAG: serine/threonine protein kinase [Planctomycetes bacterium]|nr:serine/threonine protein kinase [Planctomycetota bacterium]